MRWSSEQPCKNWIWYDSTQGQGHKRKKSPTANLEPLISTKSERWQPDTNCSLLTPDLRWYLRPLWRHHALWIPMDQPMEQPTVYRAGNLYDDAWFVAKKDHPSFGTVLGTPAALQLAVIYRWISQLIGRKPAWYVISELPRGNLAMDNSFPIGKSSVNG